MQTDIQADKINRQNLKPATLRASVIIPSHNEEKHIGKLLQGVAQQTIYDDIEVILVDSGSTDRTVEIAESYEVKIVHIKPSDFSFGRALNSGCAAAKGDILCFASAHVYPLYSNWLESMLFPFADEKVALVYGKQTGNEVSKYSALLLSGFSKVNSHENVGLSFKLSKGISCT